MSSWIRFGGEGRVGIGGGAGGNAGGGSCLISGR